jgi:hypothetical protein
VVNASASYSGDLGFDSLSVDRASYFSVPLGDCLKIHDIHFLPDPSPFTIIIHFDVISYYVKKGTLNYETNDTETKYTNGSRVEEQI